MESSIRSIASNGKKCLLCLSEERIEIFNNDLAICKNCLKGYQKRIRIKACQHCTNPNHTEYSCGHLVCESCKNSFCIYCNILCCYCKINQARLSKSFCPKHINCGKCGTNLTLKTQKCYICIGDPERYKCTECQEFNISVKSSCGIRSHSMCLSCKKGNYIINLYEICLNCENSLNLSVKPCEHGFCKTCRDKGKCKRCRGLVEECKFCGKIESENGEFPCGHKSIGSRVLSKQLKTFGTHQISLDKSAFSSNEWENCCFKCMKCCALCGSEASGLTKLLCHHSLCSYCKATEISCCPICEICIECYNLAPCLTGDCGHRMCLVCSKNTKNTCSTCQDKKTLRKCSVCLNPTQNDNLLSQDCNHMVCQQCKDSTSICLKCYNLQLLEPFYRCCYCQKTAIYFNEQNYENPFLCENHYNQSNDYQRVNVKPLEREVGDDEQLLLNKAENYIKVLNNMSGIIVKNANDVISKINKAVMKIVKQCADDIQKIVRIKNEIILKKKVRISDYHVLLSPLDQYIFWEEPKLEELAKLVCEMLTKNLINENFQDRYLSFYSPSMDSLVRFSLEDYSKKIASRKPKRFEVGSRNQIVKTSSGSFFICGGFCNGRLSTAYSMNIDKWHYKTLPFSPLPIIDSATVFIHPCIYFFPSNEPRCLSFNISTKTWSFISANPYNFKNGTGAIYDSNALFTGTQLDFIMKYSPSFNTYEKSVFRLPQGLKIFCGPYVLVDGRGVFKVEGNEECERIGDYSLNCSGYMSSFVAKRDRKYYFVTLDEKVVCFDTCEVSTKIILDLLKLN